MKLKKCLVILPLLALTLSACNSTRVSEPLDDSETSEETSQTGEEETQTTFTNYTLSIEIRYNGDVEKVPEYATAYIQGGWDSWTSWVALTENNDRYEYSFASLDLGTYEYQLVLAYEDKEPGWTYRITQDGANASFTVKEEDGDNYKNEVTVTASKALSEIIPDPNAAINNVKVTIDITLDGVSQEVLDYGSLWIEGSWDWSEGFVKCDVEEGHYTYTFTSLAPIEYEFLGVIYYKDEQLPDDNTLWDYKVNGNDNCKFTVETSSVSATLVATKALSEILPPIGGDTGDEGGTGGDDDEGKGGDQKEDENSKVIAAIISSLSDLGYLDEEWDATHVTDIDEDGVTTDYYVTSSEDEYLYGKYESGEAYGYYTDQTLYKYDGSEYTSSSYSNGYDDFLANYSDPLDVIEDLDDYSDYAELSTDSEGNYVLTYDLTEEDDAVFTFVATSSYDIIEMGYVDDSCGDNYIVAKYTVAEVQVKMQGFNINDWIPAVTEVSNYTLSFKFTLEAGGDALTVPDGGSLYITYGEEYDDYGEFLPLSASTGNTYTYLFDRITIDWYSYDIYIGYTNDEYHNANTCYKVASGYFNVLDTEGENYTNSIEEVVEQSFDAILPTTYTFYISIYYGDDLQSAPDGTTIYALGTWDNWSEDNPIALTEAGEGRYALTLTGVNVSYYEAQLILVKDGGDLSWDYRITADGVSGNVYCNVILGTTSNSTTATAVSALDNIIPANTRQTIYNYTISFTFLYNGNAAEIPSYAYIYFGAECNSWSYVALSESEGVYSTTLSSVPMGNNKYDLVLGYSDGPDYDYKIVDGGYFAVSGLEEDECVADPIETVFPFDPTTFVDPSTIEARTNFVVNYYFVDNVDNPTTYYSLPTYADAYVAGYFTTHSGSWDEPDVSSSLYKLTGNGGNSGYSVTFPTILTGSSGYNVYFLYNSSATNHNEETSFSWSHPISNSDLSMTIPTTGSSIDVKIAANPEEIFLDNADFCTLRVAIKDTSNSGDKGVIISSDADGWGGSIKMTYDSSNNDYQYYYDYTIDKGTQYKFGIFSDSSWNDRLYPVSNTSDTWADNDKNIIIASSCTNYDYTLFLITADCSNFGGGNHFTWTSYSITHPTGGF